MNKLAKTLDAIAQGYMHSDSVLNKAKELATEKHTKAAITRYLKGCAIVSDRFTLMDFSNQLRKQDNHTMKYYLITHGNTGNIFLGKSADDETMRFAFSEFCNHYDLEREFELLTVGDNPADMLRSSETKTHWDKFLTSGSYPVINVTHRI